MAKQEIEQAILGQMQHMALHGEMVITRGQLVQLLGEAAPTLNRYLNRLLERGQIVRIGQGRGTHYRLASRFVPLPLPAVSQSLEPLPNAPTPMALHAGQKSVPTTLYPVNIAPPTILFADQARAAPSTPGAPAAPVWSRDVQPIRQYLDQALGRRKPVTYQRQWVDDYQPNISSLLPRSLADALYQQGRMQGQQPASTYARKVLEQLLIDLSWTSSHLEGNRYTLLDTRELFARGRDGAVLDLDATMLYNHKEAIEFMVDCVPTHGLTRMVVCNVHATLMNGLLPDVQALGAIRHQVVRISDTVYFPSQNPHLLNEMLDTVIQKAEAIKNPVEAAFFLWLNLAYLQPFEDGNKRTSRLAANIPLMLYNCAPLSFLDVDIHDYAAAMLAVYELQNVAMATELFVWTYQRSIQKYSVILQAMGQPDPVRARYRQQLGEAVRKVVEDGFPVANVVAALALPEDDRAPFAAMLHEDLHHLAVHNCGRYRLSFRRTEDWITAGRPGLVP